jgi:hypothetical protein
MEHYAGIDVSLESASLCVVDATGRIVREAKVASEPNVLIEWLHGLELRGFMDKLTRCRVKPWWCNLRLKSCPFQRIHFCSNAEHLELRLAPNLKNI